MDNILDGATIEYESSNPVLSSFIGEENLNRVDIVSVCEYLGIGDNNFGDADTIDKVEAIVNILGKEDLMSKLENIVSEIGFKSGILDEIYSKIRLEQEINRTSKNLDNLLKQKYGNSSSI